ncbi:hypothetical protein LJB42_004003 [Komagataella kurtzmanii]|nr:hypothetical protein LJB42_004003 [Komagataella kurtzmanii]
MKAQAKDFYISSLRVFRKYCSFIGPGLMIAVAYIDPGNYATGISGGASNQYSLLCVVLMSNIIAIFLQSLCIKLGSATGHDLSRCCREHLPSWMNIVIYVFAEVAIIATDLAEVIGSAIALNILIRVPLWAGVLLTVSDVLLVMMAWRPGASMKFVRAFEYCVAALVLMVVVCFCIELSYLPPTANARSIFRGFVPSKQIFENNGIFTAASILGATVMPHSLFLGSGLVQPRLREYDVKHNIVAAPVATEKSEFEESYYSYKPSVQAIKYALRFSIVELTVTLFTLALFVNSAILIIAGATLYGTEEAVDADLYDIHSLLSRTIAPVVGTIFMLALLASGQSAGIVCTMAGQIVCEGHFNWSMKPWQRRIITRSISIVPSLVIAIAIGRQGLSAALNVSQVILSITLPFLTAPLIYFTCCKKFMVVTTGDQVLDLTNNWLTVTVSFTLWVLISVINVYALVELGRNGL